MWFKLLLTKRDWSGLFSYKFHGLRLLARRWIIHGNSRTLSHDNPPLSVLSSRLRWPQSGVRPAEDFVGALTGNKGELAVEIRSVATWLDERRRSTKEKRPWSCVRMHDHAPFEPFRDSRELFRAPVSLRKMIYRRKIMEWRRYISWKNGISFSFFVFFHDRLCAALLWFNYFFVTLVFTFFNKNLIDKQY